MQEWKEDAEFAAHLKANPFTMAGFTLAEFDMVCMIAWDAWKAGRALERAMIDKAEQVSKRAG